MRRKYLKHLVSFITLFSFYSGFCKERSGMDSILVAIQNHDADDRVALQAIAIERNVNKLKER
jgi:hypothetical protein